MYVYLINRKLFIYCTSMLYTTLYTIYCTISFHSTRQRQLLLEYKNVKIKKCEQN